MRKDESIYIIPIGLVCAVMTYRFHPILVTIIFILWMILIINYTAMCLRRRVPAGENRSLIIRVRVHNIFHKSRRLMSFAVVFCLVLFYSVLIFGTGVATEPNVKPDNNVDYTDNSLIKTNYDTIKNINEPYWSNLSEKEKLDVLQCVINVEATYLGLPAAPFLKADTLNPNTLGTYTHQTKTITISREHLNSDAIEVLDTILHECYHSYQHSLCEAYAVVDDQYKDLRMFLIIQDYKLNFSEYSRNGEAYHSQIVEQTARWYASSSVDEYFERIAQIQGKTYDQ